MKTSRNHRRWLVALLLAAAMPGLASAKVLTVGGDMACDFHNLQDALDAAGAMSSSVTIRVARNLKQPGGELVASGGDLRIVGGYADCRRERPLGKTRIGRDGEPARLVHQDRQRVVVTAIDAGASGLVVETASTMALKDAELR